MLFLNKSRTLLAVLVASLATSQCLANPLPPSTNPKAGINANPPADPGAPLKGGLPLPATPKAGNNANAPVNPGAPLKGGRKPPMELTPFLTKWMQNSEARLRGAGHTKGGVES